MPFTEFLGESRSRGRHTECACYFCRTRHPWGMFRVMMRQFDRENPRLSLRHARRAVVPPARVDMIRFEPVEDFKLKSGLE